VANLAQLNARSLLREAIGHVDIMSELPAQPHQQIAQSLVRPFWNVVTSAPEHVVSVEWAEYISDARRDVKGCWFVLMSVKRIAPAPAGHVPCGVKIVACIATAIKRVEIRVFRALRNARGSALITNTPNCVVSCAIVHDATSPARKCSNVEESVTVVVVCVESPAFAQCARKTTGEMLSQNFF